VTPEVAGTDKSVAFRREATLGGDRVSLPVGSGTADLSVALVTTRHRGGRAEKRNLRRQCEVGISVRRALLVLGGVAVVAAESCTGGQAHLATSTPSQPSSSVSPVVGGWISVREEPAGFSVSYPSTWFRASAALTPKLSNPREILAVGSYPLRAGAPPHCLQYPVNAIEDLGSTDALLWLAERQTGGDFRPQRGPFLRSDLRSDESPGCLSKPKAFFHGTLAFEDQGRNFEAYLAWGSGVPAKKWRQLLAVLDSLQFDPGPLAQHPPRCGTLVPGGKQYNTVMMPSRGAPGDEIVLSGPTFRGEDGRFFPVDRLRRWSPAA